MQVEIIPFVLTWDGMVTNFNKDYRKRIGIEDNMLAKIQFRTLKCTFELLINDTIRYESRKERNYSEFEEMIDSIDVENSNSEELDNGDEVEVDQE